MGQQSPKSPQSSLSLVRAIPPHIAESLQECQCPGSQCCVRLSNAHDCGFSRMEALPKASAGYPELLSGCALQQLWLAPHQFPAPDKKSLPGGMRETITGITLLDATRALSATGARP